MDQTKTGELIRLFRTKLGLTQKELAERLNVSDKAVSKWERGGGFPDVSLTPALAEIFGVTVETLLGGEIEKNEKEKGDMKKTGFYVCKDCGNVIAASSEASITCCGKRLRALEPRKAGEDALVKVEDVGGETLISSDMTTTKEDYISFVAYATDSTVAIFRQYPEWDLRFFLPTNDRSGKLFWYREKDGLVYRSLLPERKRR